jgi:hypothetical protein
MVFDPESALKLSALFAITGLFISYLEDLWAFDLFSETGFLSGSVIDFIQPDRSRWMAAIYSSTVYRSFLIFSAAFCVIAFLLLAFNRAGLWIAIPAFAIHFMHTSRCAYGTDGSDQINLVILAGVAAGALGVPSAGAAFIAAQCILSYFVAGAYKFAGAEWRDGTAIPSVLTTKSYGHRGLAPYFSRYGLFLCWSVMIWEIAFPLSLVSPTVCLGFMAIGVAFHLSCAMLMGLNNFVFSYLGLYPSLYAVVAWLHRSSEVV